MFLYFVLVFFSLVTVISYTLPQFCCYHWSFFCFFYSIFTSFTHYTPFIKPFIIHNWHRNSNKDVLILIGRIQHKERDTGLKVMNYGFIMYKGKWNKLEIFGSKSDSFQDPASSLSKPNIGLICCFRRTVLPLIAMEQIRHYPLLALCIKFLLKVRSTNVGSQGLHITHVILSDYTGW